MSRGRRLLAATAVPLGATQKPSRPCTEIEDNPFAAFSFQAFLAAEAKPPATMKKRVETAADFGAFRRDALQKQRRGAVGFADETNRKRARPQSSTATDNASRAQAKSQAVDSLRREIMAKRLAVESAAAEHAAAEHAAAEHAASERAQMRREAAERAANERVAKERLAAEQEEAERAAAAAAAAAAAERAVAERVAAERAAAIKAAREEARRDAEARLAWRREAQKAEDIRARQAETARQVAQEARRAAAREAAEQKRREMAADQQRLFAEARACAGARTSHDFEKGRDGNGAQTRTNIEAEMVATLPPTVDALIAHVLQARVCPYRCLGLGRTAQRRQVRLRHRELALRLHPDKTTHPRAATAFCAVQQALREAFPHAL